MSTEQSIFEQTYQRYLGRINTIDWNTAAPKRGAVETKGAIQTQMNSGLSGMNMSAKGDSI